MAWIHCLNCGWQGAVNSGKAEKFGGMAGLIAGVALGFVLHNWLIGGIVIGISLVGILVGMGSGSSLHCPHCQSTDIKQYTPS
ncbi:MAG: hypothetical protein ABI743_14025, partial [bacterium]